MTTAPVGSRDPAGSTTFRPAEPADLPDCAAIWRDALNDYMGRLNLPEIPDEPGPIGRLHAHIRSTDQDRFVVAAAADGTLTGFAAAVIRDRVWFLSMLFVRPAHQGRGLGRALLARILPAGDAGMTLATCTDAAQPISNALYSGYGIVPRMPLVSLAGRPDRAAGIERLPSGVTPAPLDLIADGWAVEDLDREVAGFAHPQDHGFLVAEGRQGFAYRGPDRDLVGYGYTSPVGRVGPVAVRDPALIGPVLGHLLTAVEPRGASAVWVPGHADQAIRSLLRAGLRFDGFPVLACWSEPFADFRRYLPISPGLL
jgi:GNAT superfamily N-acetyltransferase